MVESSQRRWARGRSPAGIIADGSMHALNKIWAVLSADLRQVRFSVRTFITGTLVSGLLAGLIPRAFVAREGFCTNAGQEQFYRELLVPLSECVREDRQEIAQLQTKFGDSDRELDFPKKSSAGIWTTSNMRIEGLNFILR